MKKIIYAISFVLGSLSMSQAQTTVQDFTKNDCAGNPHHLFAELNAGKVIILEYVMMDCAPCVVAGNGLKSIVSQYNSSNPGQVIMYSIGFDDSYTCTDLNNWKSSNNFTHTVFTGGASDVSYYGGMGMPTIVIAAGPYHKIVYKKLGYAPGDNNAIKNAINAGLVATGEKTPAPALPAFQAYPNPANSNLYLQLPQASGQVELYDVNGKKAGSWSVQSNEMTLDLAILPRGFYLLSYSNTEGESEKRKVIIQ